MINKSYSVNVSQQNKGIKSFYQFLFILFLSGCSSKTTVTEINRQEVIQVDTVVGYFFYEANVPLKCYTRNDQTEQGNNLIFFDTLMLSEPVSQIYDKGVFVYQYQPMITNEVDQKFRLNRDNKSFWEFQEAISYMHNRHDSTYTRTLYFDSKKILTYKKIYAEFAVKQLGNVEQLIPDLENYTCCYSNIRKSVPTYFIEKVIRFKIY